LRACPVCLESHSQPRLELVDHITGDAFHAVTCSSCGLVFLADPPERADLDTYYANELGRGMRHKPGRLFTTLRGRLIRKDLRKLLPHLAQEDLVVDLGTGDGSVAVELRRLGYRVVASDLSPAEEWAHAEIPYVELGANWDFAELVDAVGPPSALVLRHVLEHVHDPRLLLEIAHENGTRVVDVTVPNYESRLRPRLSANWIHWDPPRHMTYFSPETLRMLAAQTGYQVTHLETYGIDELVTSAYRAVSLRALEASERRARALRQVARFLQPKSVLSGVGSALVHPIGNSVVRCVLTRVNGERDRCG
jgi:SAM-dependent methyltransferase